MSYLFTLTPGLKIFWKRVCWTIMILFIYMWGMQIPLPFAQITSSYRRLLLKSPISILTFYSGANLTQLSLFMVGLTPMMIGMLFVQVLSYYRMFGLGTFSQRQMNYFQQFIILVFAIIQSAALTFGFGLTKTTIQGLSVILILTAGSMFVTWLGMLNGRNGIGGTILLILVNILSGIFPMVRQAVENLLSLPNGKWLVTLLLVIGLLIARFWLAFMRAYYPIKIIDTNESSRTKPRILPIGLNSGAMMTIMVGMAIIMIPLTFGGFFPQYRFLTNPIFDAVYAGIMTFTLFYFFTFVQYSPESMARGMRGRGVYILGIHPGKPTQLYLRHKIWSISLLGATLNTFTMVFGMLGPRLLDKYSGFALIPMNIMMLLLFMSGIQEQIGLYLIPRQYEKYNEKENSF
ncbi:accessory Sec system protein translocase subunit SecY2 [Lactobacillaceae bacterium 24-114]